MSTDDPVLKISGGRDNDSKKKAKKKKDKMIPLNEFMAKHGDFGAPAAPAANSWAVMTENTEDDYDSSFKFDRSQLPSAPKAALEPTVDLSQIPAKGPFSAYIGNLSYDANEEDLQRLFCKLEVDNVRIITDGGRPRGYAYVDFVTKESLIEALSYNEREWMNRSIRVDLATDKNQEGSGRPGHDRGNRSNEPDRTDSDWRRKDDDEAPSSNSVGSRDDRDGGRSGGRFGGDRDRGYGFGRDRDGDRRGGGSAWGDRDRGSSSSTSWGSDRDRGSSSSTSWGGDRDRSSAWGSDRDRGSGGSSWGGDRDRGSGGGAWGDRDRGSGYGDRDRGYGGGRDRGYGDRDRGGGGRRGYGDDFGGDRDGRRGGGYDDNRYGRRDDYGRNNGNDRGSRDGSRDGGYGGDRDYDRGGRFGGSRGGYDNRRDDYGSRAGGRQDNGYDRRPRSRDGSLENRPHDESLEHRSEGPKERPVLKLQPRTKPVETQEKPPEQTMGGGGRSASIFGSAKPVDTYTKEKEIEEKLKKRVVDREEPRRREDEPSRPRRSNEDDGDRRRKSSSGSGGGNEWSRNALPVQKPPPPHGRRASEDNGTENPKSPTSPKPSLSETQEAKMVPAPPPKENAWSRKREGPPQASTPAQTGGRDVSNNAASGGGARREDRRDGDRRDDRRPPAGRGNRPGDRDHRDNRDNRDRRPGGPRANGDDHQQVKKHQREKKVPKSIEEMPKFEEDRSRDFSTVNKYSFLMEDDVDVGDDNEDRQGGASDRKTEAPTS